MRAAALALLGAATLAPSVSAAADSVWKPMRTVDSVTGVVREDLGYEEGKEGFYVVCTHQQDGTGRKRFRIAVRTGSPLGRKAIKDVTYKVGEDEPTTSRWAYTPREVVPNWPLEDRHLVERIIARKADRIAFRLFLYDNRTHDVIAPIDAAARDLMAQTIAMCRS